MKKIALLLVMCASSVLWSVTDTMIESTENSLSVDSEKIYISLDRLVIDEEGMFVDLFGETRSILALYRDNGGYYILSGGADRYQCPNGHPSPKGDGRCSKPGCPHERSRKNK